MFIKLNKNTIYVNFNKHKLNYVICDIKDLITKREINNVTKIYQIRQEYKIDKGDKQNDTTNN